MPAQRIGGSGDVESAAIVEVLVRDGKITAEQAKRANDSFVTTGVPATAFLLQQKIVRVEDVVAARAKYYNVPFLRLTETAVSPVALGYVDKKTGMRIKPFAAIPAEVAEAVETRYEQTLTTEVTAALKEAGGAAGEEVKTINIRKVGEFIREAPIAKIVTTILEFAIKSRASDVHIEPLEDRTRVRYRIDGILHEKLVLPKKIHDSLVSRIKILSDMKIDERRIPQDG